MTAELTHDQACDALDALALDGLEPGEREAVLRHVSTCRACLAELTDARETVSALLLAAPPAPMDPVRRERVRARLLARAAADRVAATSPPASGGGDEGGGPPVSAGRGVLHISGSRAAPRLARGAWYTAAAASLLAAASLASLARVRQDRDAARAAYQTAASRLGAADSLRREIDQRDRFIANLTGPRVAVVTLASATPQAPSARMFWDQAVDQWTFVAHRLPAPRPGRRYQLWLVTPTAKISAGTFAPSPDGDAVVRARYALPPGQLAAVAVTDEPESGSPQPTTAPFIVGTPAGS